ncbi:hypothetical protein RSOLAG1IB_10954 [Rhizoctonia solani AG-1 IB]|uniref:Tc1-like transposase DDE domain-containing protein n=1 Tax=Thanatephorus cucumeris (strain AG1-IB / isolate 7/3/14) TaxID=1108050 RepID=M5BWM5_THACB|nr:hypothetical protein BN14_05606 [Rhizoctonia solani AG-1 IB]CEL63971.1 hypothetical protein RSOLAG1IB_10954 [Rhizoctonia solani AG-1 IB]
MHTRFHKTAEITDELTGSLNALGLEAPLLDDDVILEDPPNEVVDPTDDRNIPSLGEPEGDEVHYIPPPEDPQTDDDSGENSQPNRKPIPHEEAKMMVDKLNKIIESSFRGRGKKRTSTLGDVGLSRLRYMAGTLNLMVKTGLKLTKASESAAYVFCRVKWTARRVRVWIRDFQRDGTLPTNLYGTWNDSVLEDEDLSAAIREWLMAKGKYVKAHHIIEFFLTDESKKFKNVIDEPPSLRTAQRWMHRMGFTWMRERTGQFSDRHERDDVKYYREKFYVPEWMKLKRRMRSWDSEGRVIPPKLNEGEQLVVVWFHDESTFYAHDRRLTRWVHESETAGIRKKGEGVSLMVTDFISADYGWLRSRPGVAPIAPYKSAIGGEYESARVIFRAGKQRDGWFRTDHVVEQLSRAMSIVKQQYPDEEHVFVFNNATIHTKLPESAPNVYKMTLGPSQKVKGEEVGPSGETIGIEYAPVTLPDGRIQQLYHPSNHLNTKLRGAFKGMALILEERAVPNARKLKLVCASTNTQQQGCLPDATNCCARRTMMNQPDIIAQKSIIQTLAKSEGCSVMYLPKYHCELNPIEQCWGVAKRKYRECPASSLEADLKKNMLAALDSVDLRLIRRFAARSERFVHAYGEGLSGQEAAWTLKKFRGHRTIPVALLRGMDKSRDKLS